MALEGTEAGGLWWGHPFQCIPSLLCPLSHALCANNTHLKSKINKSTVVTSNKGIPCRNENELSRGTPTKKDDTDRMKLTHKAGEEQTCWRQKYYILKWSYTMWLHLYTIQNQAIRAVKNRHHGYPCRGQWQEGAQGDAGGGGGFCSLVWCRGRGLRLCRFPGLCARCTHVSCQSRQEI